VSLIEFETHEQAIAGIRAERERRAAGRTLEQERDLLEGSLSRFIQRAWQIVEPRATFVPGWHLEAIAEHLEAVSAGDIRRLQIWVPPGSMKSLTTSVFWPAWEWTTKPGIRYITGSYDLDLATDFAVKSRDLIRSSWYQSLWGDVFQMKGDRNLKQSYANDRGGERFATSPTAGATGRHGDRILIDDPIRAADADASAKTKLEAANGWYDGTLATRAADPKSYAEVIIMQRLAKGDLAEHVLGFEDWTILCLPERYESLHPHRTPAQRRLPSGRRLLGDIRTDDGELLWPARIGELENQVRAARLSAHRAAGQLQQRPSAREGSIIKRALWRYYDPALLADGETGRLPRFQALVGSWDTSMKDKATSDPVAGTLWGVDGGRRYLLRTSVAVRSLSDAKVAMKEMRAWGLQRWPRAQHWTLVENTANGPEIIAQLKREIPGVIATKPAVSSDQKAAKKTIRAEACEPDFESGNVLIAGAPTAELDGYDGSLTPAWAQEIIEHAAEFPNGQHDDDVDSITQALNWIRSRQHRAGRVLDQTQQIITIPGVV
jgi:predicted phage terminase large subunit-like protein